MWWVTGVNFPFHVYDLSLSNNLAQRHIPKILMGGEEGPKFYMEKWEYQGKHVGMEKWSNVCFIIVISVLWFIMANKKPFKTYEKFLVLGCFFKLAIFGELFTDIVGGGNKTRFPPLSRLMRIDWGRWHSPSFACWSPPLV